MTRTGTRRPLAALTGVLLGLSAVPMTAAGSAAEDGATATELFFSEYVEGSSNNKALEVYNGTGAPVDLAAGGYNVQVYFNGDSTAGTTVPLTGTVGSGDVHVLADNDAAAAVLAVADQVSTSSFFSGDDAVVLRRGTQVLDVVGQVGVDPGDQWGTGDASTQNNTLRRDPAVTAGDTDGNDPFDPAAQWTGLPQDTFDGLGSHGGPVAPVDNAPAVTVVEPRNNNREVATTEQAKVTFSEAVTLTGDALSLACAGAAVPFQAGSDDDVTWTVDPVQPLPAGASCTFTVRAAGVTDRDGTPTPMAADHVTRFSTADCSAAYTPTFTIQGSGPATTKGGTRTTEGVVVGDYETADGLGGFYLQDAAGDGDASTSDGLFVFTGYRDRVSLGDAVRVTGTVSEQFGQTQLAAFGNALEICGTGATVAPVDLELPMADTAREAYEGMLVRLPQTLAVTELYQLGRFGQVTVSAEPPYAPEALGGRLPQPTNLVEPGEEARAVHAANDRHAIVIDDADNDQNPDPIRFSRDGSELTAANTLRGGDTATGTVGVLTYTWGGDRASPNDYRVRPLGALSGHVDFVPANPRPEHPELDRGGVTAASFNVLNYFNTFEDDDQSTELCRGGVAGGPHACRGADDTAELDRQAAKIVAAIAGMDAEVLGVIEIENDGYGPDSAIADLVRRVNAVMGAGTYRYLDVDERTGQVDALGDDAIKVGLLYQPAEVRPNGETAVLNSEEFVNGGGDTPRNRPALAQVFRDKDGGGRFTMVVNHLKSKGSGCGAGDDDPVGGQGSCNGTRVRAAQELMDWLGTYPTGLKERDVLVMGDLNAYAQEDPVDVVREAGFTDLVRTFEGPGAYSYVFDGQWGYLDHALASRSLTRQVRDTTTWHINADEPPVLDYDTDFKSDAQVQELYAPTPYRSSDHDPVLVSLDLRR